MLDWVVCNIRAICIIGACLVVCLKSFNAVLTALEGSSDIPVDVFTACIGLLVSLVIPKKREFELTWLQASSVLFSLQKPLSGYVKVLVSGSPTVETIAICLLIQVPIIASLIVLFKIMVTQTKNASISLVVASLLCLVAVLLNTFVDIPYPFLVATWVHRILLGLSLVVMWKSKIFQVLLIAQVAISFSQPEMFFLKQGVEHAQVLWSTECQRGGFMTVIEAELPDASSIRILRFDHSIIGGMYIAPEEILGQSVFETFYLQDAVRLAFDTESPPRRALQIGVGIGIAAGAFENAGIKVDAIDLHPEVFSAAKQFFNFSITGTKIAEDALVAVDFLPLKTYDIIIHDVFAGSDIKDSKLASRDFILKLKKLFKSRRSVLVFSYAGLFDADLKHIWDILCSCFKFHMIAVDDPSELDIFQNYVMYLSDQPLQFREPIKEYDVVLNRKHEKVLFRHFQNILFDDISTLRTINKTTSGAQFAHWQIMEEIFPPEFWSFTI
jgi:hypothetical protein